MRRRNMRVDSRDFAQWKILTEFSLLHPGFHSQVSFRVQMVGQPATVCCDW